MDDEVIICGGSLAGCAAAIRLNQHGINARVFEKALFPRKKLCGEFLGPDSFGALESLGVFEAVKACAYGPVESAIFYTRRGKPLSIKMAWLNAEHPYGMGITRERLDSLLLQQVQRMGISVSQNCRVTPAIQQQLGRFHVELTSVEGTEEVHRTVSAPLLIDATGRHGGLHVLGREFRSKPGQPIRSRVGIKVNVRLAKPIPGKTLRMFFFKGGYGGIQPLSETVYNVCMLAPAQSALLLRQPFPEFLENTIGQNPVAKDLLQGAVPVEPFQTTANINLDFCNTSTGLLQVGDAMITVDPFTGSGMTLALQTGILAADTIAEGIMLNWEYETLCRVYQQRYQRMLGLRLKLLRYFRPFLFSGGMQEWVQPMLNPFLPALAKAFR